MMIKKNHIVIGAIPTIIAILIIIPLVTKSEIPYTAANSNDVIELEYTKYHLKKISYGVTDRTGAQKTEILKIEKNGDLTYSINENGYLQPEKRKHLDESKQIHLIALIKETGIMSIPSESFPVNENSTEYQKLSLKMTLNGASKQISWPEQNATSSFIPPILQRVQMDLDEIMDKFSE